MSQFSYPTASHRVPVKGQNNPPSLDRITANHPDDALMKQQGHGICKGLAATWVIAFLNEVKECHTPTLFHEWFTNFAKFQGTYVKNAGGHIDEHLEKMYEAGVLTGVEVESIKTSANLSPIHFPANKPWAAYCSVWKHDVAIGSTDGHLPTFFIMEPNDGLFLYDSEEKFLADFNTYLEERRQKKSPADNKFAAWYCTGHWKRV